MVLPGIQALFGFQLIAVFNSSFTERLTPGEQRLHLVAIALVVVAIALIMTPAAFHRQQDSRRVTARMLALSTRLLLWSMGPLAVGICLDLYLVARLIAGSRAAALLAGLVFAVFLTLWVALPRIQRLSRWVSNTSQS
jgi:hypothetical protein